MLTKTCTHRKCSQINPQPLDNFCKNSRSKDGLNRICRSCVKIYKKSYYKQNCEKIITAVQKYTENNHEKVKNRKKTYYYTHTEKIKADSRKRRK